MATTTTLLQHHPLHDKQHPLELRDFRNDSITPPCHLCSWPLSANGYNCEKCKFYAHRACAEAPPRIDSHPLHTDHPLTLMHRRPPFRCDSCGEDFTSFFTSFRCDECDFDLDIRCALSTLSDRGGTQGKTPKQIELPLHIHPLTSLSPGNYFIGDKGETGKQIELPLHIHPLTSLSPRSYFFGDKGKTRKQIELPLHIHPLTSFSAINDFIGNINCVICKESEKRDGYMCSGFGCRFLIHKRCVPDLYFTDGTKAPQVYHSYPLKTFLGEETGSSRCGKCGSKSLSGEFIGCEDCLVFYCRDCIQVPECIQYPHHPNHTLVLLISSLDDYKPRCDSCFVSLEGELCYGCPSCEFFVDVGCALQVLAYCGEGMSTKIELSWHEHQLHLCHGTESHWHQCSNCENKAAGPMYACKEVGGEILLHKRCTEIESTIIHPHHPDHPLTLGNKACDQNCGACGETITFLGFSCELCAFYLHAKCSAYVPTRKHSLHEHELLHLDKAPIYECNRCSTSTNASLFRCVPCDFNIHEACMELPRVVKSEIHWHSLTLHEKYVEDDSGEYYCDQCENSRDVRLGAYVCLQCRARWAYHIECVLPELGKVYAENIQTSAIKRMDERIGRKSGQVRAAEEKLEEDKLVLDELKWELDELMKRKEELISGG